MANNLKCKDCGEYKDFREVTYLEDGMVEGIAGMKKHIALCVPCVEKRKQPPKHWQD